MAQKEYRCKVCDAKFGSELELERHKRSTHPEYRCEVCGHTFKSENELSIHSWVAHPEDIRVR